VDVVVADQHYVYGLTGSLGGQLSQDERRWSVLLDEAHNLPERAIGMYSATLAKAELMAARKSQAGPVLRALDRLNRVLLGLQGEAWDERDYTARDELPAALLDGLQKLVAAIGEQQVEQPAFLHRNPRLLDFYYSVLQFIRVAENWGDEYRFILSRGRGKQSLALHLNCLDPSRLLAQRQQRLHSVTAFSATLSPVDWARRRLGLGDQAVYSRQRSPFDPGQLEVELATHIDTRYRARQASLPELAGLVRHWLGEVDGNTIVYFPSYQYLRDCLGLIADNLQGRTLWVQEPELSDPARDQLLAMFERSRNMVAFCILGGIFGEGIDLPGEQLSSVVVVGVGLPQVNRNTELLRQWYQSRYGAGFEYAYLYPGMQKVDQALGRVIRRARDRGRALLIDNRYRRQEYRSLLPCAWTYRVLDPDREED
jgi:DNA excision repair protein ERCC-2